MIKMKNEQLVFNEIVEQDEDIQKFYSFIKPYKEDSEDDINEMEYNELKKVIKKFKDSKKNDEMIRESKLDILSDISEEEIDNLENFENTEKKFSTIFSEKHLKKKGDWKNGDFFEIVTKNQLKFSTFFSEDDIKCEIVDFTENVEKGIFYEKKKKSFSIKTNPFDWVVERDLEDFVNLKNSLKNSFPFLIVPEIDEVKFKFLRKFPHKFSIQKNYFESFLEMILKNPYLKNSHQIESFLKDSKIDFYKLVKKCDKIKYKVY